ncbi:alpha/beta hydrolase [Amorphus sp. 3PC139-8]|uniref:alpha/beta hydrolase n=1 Tax=Amorphus sp. 3PC139-8 TaxID=2735676 RepID=UPI00345D0DD8
MSAAPRVKRGGAVRRTVLLLFFGLATGGLASANQYLHADEISAEVRIPGSQMRDITATTNGRDYRLMIWTPSTPPPPQGYPVVYVTDGNALFGTVRDAIDIRSRVPRTSGLAPAVVVAIGYPGDAPYDIERRAYDLTPPVEMVSMPPRPNGKPWPPLGGADAFLTFIETDVKPLVAGLVPVDPSREVLLGHSFGGLFALHVLFTDPGAFDTYVSLSPSIWFNDRMVVKTADAFLNRPAAERGDVSLFLSVGGLEQRLTSVEDDHPQAATRRKWKANNRMVDNAREMAIRLQDADGLDVEFVEFPDEDHTSVLPASISRGLSFALPVETTR